MKRFRLLPSILMLVMCIAVLGVGIYAVTPSQNNVTGTITVIASNPEISITAYYESAIEGNEIGESQTTRTGVEIDITDTRMTFDTSNANTASDVDSKYVVIKLQNNSSTEMGVYFAMSETATSTATTPALNLSGETLAGTPVSDIMEVSFSPYAKLPANGSVTMQLSFKLLNLYDENYTIDLSDYTIYLNTETPVNTEYLQTFSITEGLTNNEEKNEVALGSSNVLTSTFDLTASQALTGLYAGTKECSIKVTDKTSEVLTFAFDIPENTCVSLFSEMAYQVCYSACGGDIGAMLVKAAEYKGAQTIPGVDGELGFYTTNLDMGQYLNGNVVTYDRIEIPLEYVFVENNTLDMYIVVGALGTDTATITMTTYFSGNYEDARYVLNADNESYTYYTYKNHITTPESGEVIIPDEYNGKPVTIMGDYVFNNNTELKSIIISDNITEINSYAFAGCANLATVSLSSSLTELKRGAFINCLSLVSIDLSVCKNLKTIGWDAFCECTSLKTVNFSGLTNLTELGDGAFYGCSSLESVDLSDCIAITLLNLSTFTDCTRLEVCILPPYLQLFCGDSFVNCVSLKEIVIPASVTNLGTADGPQFTGCTQLEVKYKGTSVEFKEILAYDNVLETHSVYCMGDGVTIEKL